MKLDEEQERRPLLPPRSKSSVSSESRGSRESRLSRESSIQHEEGDKTTTYPKSVFFLLFAEVCERFNYSSVKAVLVLYLGTLLTSDAADTATLTFHVWDSVCYASPLLGAILADSFLGKYKAVLYLFGLYIAGQFLLTWGSVPGAAYGLPGLPQLPLSLFGLLFIGLASGGIKPCVIALGADQFVLPQQQRHLLSYFSLFYFCVNLGGIFSYAIAPVLRNQTCFRGACFFLAFAVPTGLVLVAFVCFVCGHSLYKVELPERNVLADFFRCIWEGVCGKQKEEKGHWLDPAKGKFGHEFVQDVKAVLKVAKLFLFYPMFWAVFSQMSSRWTLMAAKMDGRIGSFLILPEQMHLVNSVLVLVFLPLFDNVVYPVLGRFGLLRTPLQKIVTGGLFTAASFILAAGLEWSMQQTYPVAPRLFANGSASARLAVHNGFGQNGNNCAFNITLTGLPNGIRDISMVVRAGKTKAFENAEGQEILPFLIPENVPTVVEANGNVLGSPISSSGCSHFSGTNHSTLFLEPGQSRTLVLFPRKYENSTTLVFFESQVGDLLQLAPTGAQRVRFMYSLPSSTQAIELYHEDNLLFQVETRISESWLMGETSYDTLNSPGSFNVCIIDGDRRVCDPSMFSLSYGGSYNIYLNGRENYLEAQVEELTPTNKVHMLWMVPQYIVITIGDVMFVAIGYQFSFTQAPKSMKTVVVALYFLAHAFGNLLVVLFIGTFTSWFHNQALEFLLFAAILALDMLVLAIVAKNYTYVEYR